MLNLGTIRPGSTIYIPFDTFAGATGASITMTGLAVTDIEVYKDGSVTQRASDAGYTLLDTDGIDFDGITGIHGFSINLADNTTAGFWAAGSKYFVVVSAITVDTQTVSFVAASFQIGYPDAILDTTIATLASQTSFTLTVGPAEDDALNGCTVIIHDVASAVQLGKAIVGDYTGSTRTVTLIAGVTFTAAATDNISVFVPALQPTVWGRTFDISATGEGGLDWANIGSPTTAQNLSATNIDVDQVVASVSGAVGSVSGAVGSVTGNVGGNVTGSVGSVASGGITATSIAADAIGASELAADAITEIRSLVSGTSDSGTTLTMVDAARTEADTDYWKGAWILFTSGNISGQCRLITGFNAATDTITFAPATTQAVATQTYEILPNNQVDIGQWLGATPSALISGRVDANTQAMAAGVITATVVATDAIDADAMADGAITAATFAAGAIDATAIAADAIGSSELAASAITEIQSGLATSAALATVQADTDDIQTRLPAALVGGRIDSNVGAISSDVTAADNAEAFFDGTGYAGTGNTIPTVTTITNRVTANVDQLNGGAQSLLDLKDFADDGYDPATNKVQGVVLTDTVTTYTGNTPQTGDSFARLGAPAGASISVDIAAIEAQTDDIGAAGAGLTAIPWNAAWDAEVQSEVDDALVARFLDKLVIVNGTADSGSTTTMVDAARTEADNDYWKGRIILFTSGNISGQCAIITDFVAATDTFTFAPPLTQAVSTQTYVILPSISVWDDTLAEHLISGSTGSALNAAGAAGDPWSTALPGAYGAGTAGLIVGTNLDATVSSRLAPTTAGRTLDVTATGAAGIDWANVENSTTALNLSGTNIDTDQVVASVAGAVGSVTAGVTVTTNSDKTGYTLSAAGIQAIWDALTSALSTANSIGKLLVDNVNATISSRSSHSAADIWSVATRLLSAGTNIVLAKGVGVTGFNDLSQADVRTAIGLASTNLDTQLDTLPTAGENADAVWDETLSGHLGAGSTGEALNAAGAAGDPWTTSLPGAYGAGSAGNIVGNRLVGTIATGTHNPQSGDSFARLGAPAGASVSADILAVDNLVDDLETRIGTPSNLGSGATVAANLVDIEGQTDDIGAAGAGLTAIPTIATVTNLTNLPAITANWLTAAGLAADAITEIQSGLSTLTAAQVWDLTNGIETGLTPRQAMRIIAAATAGKLSGAATVTVTIRNAVADDANRITATVDADGNRTAIVYSLG